jgi:hypothetical protein
MSLSANRRQVIAGAAAASVIAPLAANAKVNHSEHLHLTHLIGEFLLSSATCTCRCARVFPVLALAVWCLEKLSS